MPGAFQQAEVRDALQVLLCVCHRLCVERSTKFLALAIFTDRTLPHLSKVRDVPADGRHLWLIACACILVAAKLRPAHAASLTTTTVIQAAKQVLGSKATCTGSDLGSAECWLASAVDVSQGLRLVSDILQDTLAGLQRTGMPALTSPELPDLCFNILEALHSNTNFQGCLTRGGSLTAVAIIGAGVLLTEKKQLGSLPGVMTLLSDFGGHPQQVILGQIKTIMTTVLS